MLGTITKPRLQSLAIITSIIVATCSQLGGIVAAATPSGCPKGMSQLDCSAIHNDWAAWVPDVCGQSAEAGGTTITGDYQKSAFLFLVGKGLSPAGAAGVVGNLIVESGVDPNDEEVKHASWTNMTSDSNFGVGIAQWDGSRRPTLIRTAESQGITLQDLQNFAKDKNVSDKVLAFELAYLWQELTTQYQPTYDKLKTASDAAQAAVDFEEGYEKAAGGGRQDIRAQDAVAVLAKYGAGVQASPGSTTTSSPGCGAAGTGGSAGSGFLGDPGAAAVIAVDPQRVNGVLVAQCVGYVMYELGIHSKPYIDAGKPGLPDGVNVASKLASLLHLTLNTTPAVHAVFSMPIGDHGHTGFVSAITLNPNGSLNTFTVEEYNWVPGAYDTRTLDASYIAKNGLTFAHTEVGWQ